MYVLLFEDNPNTPSSKLLKNSYNGKAIHFSDGNLLIRNEIQKLLEQGNENIIVYLDVNPNNESTVGLLNTLGVIKLTNKRWKNVIIVPIVCIEFYIAKICKQCNYFDKEQLRRPIVRYLVDDFNWDAMPETVKTKSLEKIYKRLFETNGKCQPCLNNRQGSGKFFLQDCNCTECSLSNASMSLKAEQLYTSLPVFEVAGITHEEFLRECNISHNTLSLKKLLDKQQTFYDDICVKMGKERFLINTIE